MIEREQAHHEAGRAEPALRAVLLDHRLLHGMQPAFAREIFHRDDLAAVGLAREQNARVDGLIDEPLAPHPPQHDRAGAAVAFGAAFLGAGRAFAQAQIIEQRQRG